jgi:hypothetical protein
VHGLFGHVMMITLSPAASFGRTPWPISGSYTQSTNRYSSTSALENIGLRNAGATDFGYGHLPGVQRGWGSSSAFFKAEGAQVNIGLGRGDALNVFNRNLIRFTLVK